MEWTKKVPKLRDEIDSGPNLSQVFEFIIKHVRITNDPQFGHLATKFKTAIPSAKPTRTGQSKRCPNSIRQMSTMVTCVNAEVQERIVTCPCCKEMHSLKPCMPSSEAKNLEEIKDGTLYGRRDFVMCV